MKSALRYDQDADGCWILVRDFNPPRLIGPADDSVVWEFDITDEELAALNARNRESMGFVAPVVVYAAVELTEA